MKFNLFLAFLFICVWSIDIQSPPKAKLHIPNPGKGKVDLAGFEKSDFFGSTMNELIKRASISNIMQTNSTSKLSNSLAIPSFINELVKTDPNKVKPIVQLLKELVVHINTDLKSFEDGMIQAQQTLSNSKSVHENAQTKSLEAKANSRVADEEEASAKSKKDADQTKYDDAKTAYNAQKPVLLKHIEIVQSVIKKLELLYSSPWKLVVNVTNPVTNTDLRFWQDRCGEFGQVTVDSIMRLTMGDFVDYFKPSQSESFCKFIIGNTFKHSFKESGPYVAPPRYGAAGYYGGSSKPFGERCYLSFWGIIGERNLGGCCASKKGQCAWKQTFWMHLKK